MAEREIRKCLTFVIRQIVSKNFRENNTQTLVISKRLKFPYDDRTDTNYIARLESKSSLDSLKSVTCILEETVVGCL